jgi:hypothetical protein
LRKSKIRKPKSYSRAETAYLDKALWFIDRRCRHRIKLDRLLFLRSCFHRRMSIQPVFWRYRETVRSRFRLFAILADQNSMLDLGIRPCSGQPCQKHPSTNSTVRYFGKTKSGFTQKFRRPPPPHNFAVTEKFNQREFGSLISLGSNASHLFRSSNTGSNCSRG